MGHSVLMYVVAIEGRSQGVAELLSAMMGGLHCTLMLVVLIGGRIPDPSRIRVKDSHRAMQV